MYTLSKYKELKTYLEGLNIDYIVIMEEIGMFLYMIYNIAMFYSVFYCNLYSDE